MQKFAMIFPYTVEFQASSIYDREMGKLFCSVLVMAFCWYRNIWMAYFARCDKAQKYVIEQRIFCFTQDLFHWCGACESVNSSIVVVWDTLILSLSLYTWIHWCSVALFCILYNVNYIFISFICASEHEHNSHSLTNSFVCSTPWSIKNVPLLFFE